MKTAKSFVLKNISVQRKYTNGDRKKTADIHRLWRVVLPPGGGTVHSPSGRVAGLNRLLHRHFFYFVFLSIFLFFE